MQKNPAGVSEHDPEKFVLGLDPGMEAGFPKRSCSIKMLQRKSLQSEAIYAVAPAGRFEPGIERGASA
jgi:hypothetical protein